MRSKFPSASYVVAALMLCRVLSAGGPAFAQAPAQAGDQASSAESVPTSPATASVPRLIRIHGSVRDESGKPLSASTAITFTLYRDQTDQAPVWQETQTVQPDASGHYGVLLGSTNEAGLPIEIFSANDAHWLGVRPDGQAEQPRILLLSVAYALKAADSEMLGGKPASAFALVANQTTAAQSASGQLNVAPNGVTELISPNTACTTVTSDGTGVANKVIKFTTACNIESSAIFESGGNVGIGNTAPAGALDVTGTAFFRGSLSAFGGAVMMPTGTATTSTAYVSNPLDLEASLYNTTLSKAASYIYRWEAEPTGNDTASTSATLNLLFGVTGSVSETGLSVNNKGILTFASGQTFPGGSGTVTNVATGAGLTGGPITTTGTISIPSAGVTNAMLANSSVTVKAGTGLSGGGAVALGGTVTLNSTATGTVTNVATGAGLTGGPITTTGTISIPSAGVTNAMLSNSALSVTAGTGLTGGGSIALGGSGTLNLNTTYTDARYLLQSGGTLTGALTGTSAKFTTGDFSGALSAAGALLPTTGTATVSAGFNSNPFDLQASSYSTKTAAAVPMDFRWVAEPTGNDTASPSGKLNLQFGSGGTAPAETGISIASTGIISFATGQTFPGSGGSGTVTSVNTGAGLTGGPITSTGTISIPSAGVTNTMLANPSITVAAGSGLSGGGTVALGGTVTLASTTSGTVTTVNTGTGLSGGPITSSGTISIPTGGVTNTLLANPSITVAAGSGLSGGGTVALGGTITLTNTSPSSGGTVTSVATGTGLSGGPITGSGTLSLNTSYTDSRYLQLTGGTLTGALTGTSGTFTSGLSATTGSFSSTLAAAGELLPPKGPASSSQGYTSNPVEFEASAYNSSSAKSITQNFEWQAEPVANNTANPSGTLNFLYSADGTAPGETGLSIGSNGVIAFASGQTFPGSGSGTVTSVNTGAGLTGGPITATGTISIPSAGVTNTMLANPSVTVAAGSGLSGGGTVALGGTVTLASTTSGTVTTVNTGTGLTGGPITNSGTISIPNGGVTNTLLANPSITVAAGSGLSGGGTVALGGTITLTNTAPSSGGTVTNVASGTGLTGGPITGSGTLSLNTTYTDARYLLQTGGTLTGALTGTSAAFPSGLSSAAGTFTGLLSAAGELLPKAGTATSTQGFNSNPLDLQASSFNSSSSAAIPEDFRWLVEPTGNNTAAPSAKLDLLFGANGTTPGETGLSIASNGIIAFATGQTFPGSGGSGTVTTVNTGAGLTGGPITSSGTISIPSAGVTNSMLANPAITVTAGSGLTGGGTVALGGSVTLASTTSGTVTTVNTGAGLTGGPITSTGTISIPTGGVTNALLANPSITVAAGSGLSGGGTVALGGTVTLSSTSSGTVTTVNTGTGLTGGPITGTGTISIPTGGVTNSLLANPSITVAAGSGLSGGGIVALGGTITLTNTAPSSGGTVTSVASGTGLTGGPITGTGTLSLNTAYTDSRYLLQTGGTLTGALTGTSAAFPSGLSASTGSFTGTVTEAGALVSKLASATSTQAYNSNALELQASAFNSSTSAAVAQNFLWTVEPTGNNTANPSGTLNLLFAEDGSAPTETGLSVASNGVITFSPSQTFPGGGGGGGGTVTTVNTGAGLAGGPITTSGTISIPSAGVTNTMLANPAITVTAGTGLSGGGTVALGGTITLTNTAPSSGGTVTSVTTSSGILGGPISTSGNLSLDTSFTNNLYLQLAGGTLTGGLSGTTASFTGGLSASTGTFSGALTEAGDTLPTTGTATASQGFNSNALDLQASSFNSTSLTAVAQDFRWMAEPTANNSASPSGTLNLLYGASGAAPAETGLSIANTGVITFASGQTFPGQSGSGTVTSVNTGAGLTGGPITSTGTIGIAASGVSNAMLANPSITVNAGTGLTGGGVVALGGSVTLASNLSGTTNGVAYFSSPTALSSTAAPANGQILVGSTDAAPALATLTAGPNVSITNGPGSITISAAGGGSPALPFFVTGGGHTGGTNTPTANVNKVWGMLLPYSVTTSQVTFDVTTADATANLYDIGIYNNSGTLMVDLGPIAGTTLTKAFHTLSWAQGATTLAPGRYYLAMTTNCTSGSCAAFASGITFVSYAINTSAGASSGGALSATITPPADSWNTNDQPMFVLQ